MAGRALGVDLGGRRIGLALSDASGLLARPYKTLTVTAGSALNDLVREIEQLADDEDRLAVIVVGLPKRLDGQDSEQTARVTAMVAALRARTDVPVVTEDERLSSHEAEQRLAVRERDWRKRKAQLDAAAAAVFLQDYLDRQASLPVMPHGVD